MARQFRSDDSSPWPYKYGNGSDGSLTINSNTTFNATNISCSGTSGDSTLTLGSAGFSDGDLILIHQSRGTGNGAWELNRVSSGGGTTTLTLSLPLQNTYTDSGASQAQVVKLAQYSSVTVDNTYTWTAPTWNGDVGGILAFLCNGTTTIAGAINATSKGFVGGSGGNNSGAFNGQAGEGNTAAAASTSDASANGSGGGQGRANDTNASGGGNGSTGSGTGGGSTAGNAELTSMVFGGGGGGLSRDNQSSAGSNGGGIIVIISKTITVTGSMSSGSSTTSLANAGGSPTGSGATGAGGSILLKGQNLTLGSSLITASAGASGGGTRAGETGGAGRIHADYAGVLSGTTTPSIDSRIDTALLDGGGSFVFNLI